MPTMTLDLPEDEDRGPHVDDIVVTCTRVYRVADVRPVDSRQWCNRWRLTTELIGVRTFRARAGEWARFSALEVEVPGKPGVTGFPTVEHDTKIHWTIRALPHETPAEFFARVRG